MTERKGFGRLAGLCVTGDPDALKIPGQGTAEGFALVRQSHAEARRAARAERSKTRSPGKRRRAELMEAAREHYWSALPDMIEALVIGAKNGGVAELKLLMELGGLDRGVLAQGKPARKPKPLAELLMEQMRRDREAAAAAEVQRQADATRSFLALETAETGAKAKEEGEIDGV